jgi:FKBP-type peptidyl-prolyl cis-trans isomerase
LNIRNIVRKSLAITASALLLLSLAGCAGSGTANASCELLAQPGANTKAVTVTGEFEKKPTVKFTPGITATTTQAQAIITGTGAKVQPGQTISIDFAIYNGKTGALIQESAFDGKARATIPVDVKQLGGIAKAVQCQTVGSRIVSTIGNDEALATSLGLTKNDTIVAVFDIVKANPVKADGVPQRVEDGLPQVVLSESGAPGITIPNSAPPTKLKVAVLKKGSGAVVPAHSTVTVQYTGVIWKKDAQPFDSSWTRGTPADFPVDQVVPGFRDAIVGQTVGSQVLAIIPPDQGYGATANGAIPANSTLVFVIDILGVN